VKPFEKFGNIGDVPFACKAEEFEKDVDDNFHIDWIQAASNLRSENYGLE
jgi:hypothetical protein